jgi:hypothetical protein
LLAIVAERNSASSSASEEGRLGTKCDKTRERREEREGPSERRIMNYRMVCSKMKRKVPSWMLFIRSSIFIHLA